MFKRFERLCHTRPRLRGDKLQRVSSGIIDWIPACAGMTEKESDREVFTLPIVGASRIAYPKL